MNGRKMRSTGTAVLLTLGVVATTLAVDFGPGFTYQGELKYNGSPPPWSQVELRFRLLDGDTLAQVPGSGQSISTGVPLTDGVFSTTVNSLGEFGPNAFDGSSRKLEVEAFFEPNIVITFPPQDVLATPYAQHAGGGAGDAWQASGLDLYYDQGNVGVGTNTPAALLHVGQGDESSLHVGMAPHIALRRDLAADRFRLQIGGNNWGDARLLQIGRDDGGMPVSFTGDIGIGTDEPFVATHLRGKDLNADTLSPGISSNTDMLIESQVANLTLLGEPSGNSDAFIDFCATDLNGTSATRVDHRWRILKRSVNASSGRGDLQLTNSQYNTTSGSLEQVIEHTFADNGKIGFGTLAPLAGLHFVQPDSATTAMLLEGGFDGADPGIVFEEDGGATVGVGLNEANAAAMELRTGGSTRMTVTQAGDVGIGIDAPADRLHVDGTIRVEGDLVGYDGSGDQTVDLDPDSGGAPTLALRTRTDGGSLYSAVFMDAEDGATDRGARVYVRNSLGNTTVDIDGDIGDAGCIEIKDDTTTRITLDANWQGSGSSRIIADVLQLNGADLSEQFDISGPVAVEAGLVVSIDPANPGKLIVAEQAYDRKVAGIVSGAGGVRTGLLMGQAGTLASGRHAVALTGRVWCQADAGFGSIEPGDLLTTSTTPGHAMVAGDDARSRGAVIGKAMTALEHGTGMVLVLVQPQ